MKKINERALKSNEIITKLKINSGKRKIKEQ